MCALSKALQRYEAAKTTRDYIPRSVMEAQVAALTERCVKAEDCVFDLLNLIDPELLERHGFDWYEATQEVVG